MVEDKGRKIFESSKEHIFFHQLKKPKLQCSSMFST